MKIGIVGMGVVGEALRAALGRRRGLRIAARDAAKGHDDGFDGVLVAFVCVPTPFDPDCGVHLRHVRDALAALDDGVVACVRSTVLPGTTDALAERYPGLRLVHAPEFLTEATALEDASSPARSLVGFADGDVAAAELVRSVLPAAPYCRIVTAKEAEFAKYASNAFYALKVAWANQLFGLCRAEGVDYEVVRAAAERDPMIAPNHLDVHHRGYRGFGGKCLPKDARALAWLAGRCGADVGLLREALRYNDGLTMQRDDDR